MSWDSVPWFVGGGAQHSPEVGRILAYAATSGSSGIIGAADLRVAPLAVPAGQVRVLPGACVVPNRSTGGTYQSYIGRLPTEDVVDIAPTGSSGGRTDLVIARVEDPFVAGTPWQEPTDPTAGPYIFTRVLSNVPSSAVTSPNAAQAYLKSRGYSAIPLASVTLPASTGTVTSSMVKSLREMSNPRRQRDVSTVALTAAGGSDTLNALTPGDEYFPDQAANAVWGAVEIPEWATEVRVVATWCQMRYPAGSFTGSLYVQLGVVGGTDSKTSQTVYVNTPGATGDQRATITLGDHISIPASLRGTVQPIRPRGYKSTASASSACPVMDAGSAFIMDLEFLEAPTEDDI